MGIRKRIGIVGATGYSGGELAALLADHPDVEIAGVFSGTAGAPFSSLHPRLRGRIGPTVAPFDPDRLLDSGAEIAFLAIPAEASIEAAPRLLDAGLRVIDLSGAFRLAEASAYPRWYGFNHPRPDLLAAAVYGLPEWCDAALDRARLVANPGCYPTSVLLALKPILPLIDAQAGIICDSASGVSGAGRRSEAAYSFAEVDGNFKAYAVGTHKHEPEMREQLALDEGSPFVFAAHLLPTVRGILSTIHVAFSRPTEAEEVSNAYESAYADRPMIDLLPVGALPDLRDVTGTPRAAIGFVLLAGGRRAVVVSAIDNLLKGAASQAVQNMNRLFGFAETEGLR